MLERSCNMVGNRIQRRANAGDVAAVLHVNTGAGVGEDQTLQAIDRRIVILSVIRLEIRIDLCDVKRGLDTAAPLFVQLQSDAVLTGSDFNSLHAFTVWPVCELSSSPRSSCSEMTGMFIFRAFWSLFEPEAGSAATRCVTSWLNVSV